MRICLTVLALVSPSILWAQKTHTVKPHVTKRGTYVAPHVKTNPNKTQRDNYSAKGNYNPYTGKTGTKTPKK